MLVLQQLVSYVCNVAWWYFYKEHVEGIGLPENVEGADTQAEKAGEVVTGGSTSTGVRWKGKAARRTKSVEGGGEMAGKLWGRGAGGGR